MHDSKYVTEEGDLVMTFPNRAEIINFSGEGLSECITLTEDIIDDAVALKITAFKKKHQSSMHSKSPMAIEKVYRIIRECMVDQKLPLRVETKDHEVNLPKKQRVENLYRSGITSPKAIADQINANPSYVSGIISKLRKNDSNSE